MHISAVILFGYGSGLHGTADIKGDTMTVKHGLSDEDCTRIEEIVSASYVRGQRARLAELSKPLETNLLTVDGSFTEVSGDDLSF